MLYELQIIAQSLMSWDELYKKIIKQIVQVTIRHVQLSIIRRRPINVRFKVNKYFMHAEAKNTTLHLLEYMYKNSMFIIKFNVYTTNIQAMTVNMVTTLYGRQFIDKTFH